MSWRLAHSGSTWCHLSPCGVSQKKPVRLAWIAVASVAVAAPNLAFAGRTQSEGHTAERGLNAAMVLSPWRDYMVSPVSLRCFPKKACQASMDYQASAGVCAVGLGRAWCTQSLHDHSAECGQNASNGAVFWAALWGVFLLGRCGPVSCIFSC